MILSVLTSFILAGTTIGFPSTLPGLLLFTAGIILSALLFTLFGFLFAARIQRLYDYMIIAGCSLAVFFALPFIDYFGLIENELFSKIILVIPTVPALYLINAGLNNEGITLFMSIFSILYLILWICILYIWASRWFQKYIIAKIGGGV